MELVCQLLPSPISTRLYDTYPETVKVSLNGKDNGHGQAKGRSKNQKSSQDARLAPSKVEGPKSCRKETRGEQDPGGRPQGRCPEACPKTRDAGAEERDAGAENCQGRPETSRTKLERCHGPEGAFARPGPPDGPGR